MTPSGWENLLVLMLVGGIVAVDGTSLAQLMISRPLVAATLGGWVAGDPVQGATMGLVLEAFHLGVLPVGAAKYPEGGPTAVAAGAVYANSGLEPSTLLVLVAFALQLEWIGGQSVQLIRHLNVRLVAPHSRSEWNAGDLERRHLMAIGVDFVRGMVLVALGLLLLRVVLERVVPLWGLSDAFAESVLWALVAGLIASAVRMIGANFWFVAAGAAVALTLVAA